MSLLVLVQMCKNITKEVVKVVLTLQLLPTSEPLCGFVESCVSWRDLHVFVFLLGTLPSEELVCVKCL